MEPKTRIGGSRTVERLLKNVDELLYNKIKGEIPISIIYHTSNNTREPDSHWETRNMKCRPRSQNVKFVFEYQITSRMVSLTSMFGTVSGALDNGEE